MQRRSTLRNYTLVLLLALAVGCGGESYDIVLQSGRVMDPASGLDAIRDVGVKDGKIAAISESPLNGDRVIDMSGLVVAPGFIDLHAHGQTPETYALMVQDGVTSGFELEVGTADVDGWYAEREGGQVINYGVSIGHIQVRMAVMGDAGDFLPSSTAITEPASPEQIEEMQNRITEGLDQGAIGVGFGIAYTPATTMEEFQAMLSVAAERGASSHIHVRSGPGGVEEAIEGAAATGAALHVVHANSSGAARTNEFLAAIQAAREAGQDVTTEAYPYEAGMTRIESALFDDWETYTDEEIGIHQWSDTGEFLTRETFGRYREMGGGVIIHERTEEMTLAAISNPITMIASDGFMSGGKGHPRTSGTYAKILRKYVREQGVLSLMDALAKMTSQPASRLSAYVPAMANKGRIAVGADADITAFNPKTVSDNATYLEPALPSEGIDFVLVNGVVVVDKGELNTDVAVGQPIRRMDAE